MKLSWTLYVCITSYFADAIYNGEYHPITDFPYMAQIQSIRPTSIQYCGAAILSADWIISAAHCVGKVISEATTQVITGSSVTVSGGKLMNITNIFVHGDYEIHNANADVCLIKLARPIEFNEYQQPIQISKKFPKVGDNITVTGYGLHHHGVRGASLASARVPIIEHELCNNLISKFYSSPITENHFCTSTEDVELCPGDSGSPAVFDNQLIGILNFGCKNKIPSGFTKVANYYDWIMETTRIKYDN